METQKYITKSKYFISNFNSYVYSFYGKDEGIYKNFFNNSLTWSEIENATKIRLLAVDLSFTGDSLDREIIRDIIFKLRDPKAKIRTLSAANIRAIETYLMNTAGVNND